MSKRTARPSPPNFVDLRQPQKPHALLIQDIWNSPSARHFRLLPARLQLGLLVGIIFMGLSLALLVRHSSSPYFFPKNIQKHANFQLYSPATLPDGYDINKRAAKLNEGVLFYTISNLNGSSNLAITVSEQIVPSP